MCNRNKEEYLKHIKKNVFEEIILSLLIVDDGIRNTPTNVAFHVLTLLYLRLKEKIINEMAHIQPIKKTL